MRTFRYALGAVALATAAYGVVEFVRLRSETRIEQSLLWYVGTIALHDAVLVPLVLLVGVAAHRVLPGRVRTPVLAGLVVLGVTLLATAPTWLAGGRRDSNPTALPSDYGTGVAVVTVAVLVATAVAVAVSVATPVVRSGRRRRRVVPTGPAPDEEEP